MSTSVMDHFTEYQTSVLFRGTDLLAQCKSASGRLPFSLICAYGSTMDVGQDTEHGLAEGRGRERRGRGRRS